MSAKKEKAAPGVVGRRLSARQKANIEATRLAHDLTGRALGKTQAQIDAHWARWEAWFVKGADE